jgi:LysM repeat protein
MRRATNASFASAGGLSGRLTLATICIALAAGCGTTSSGNGGRHDNTTTGRSTPTVTAATTTTTAPPPTTYQVKRGDTLTTIAKQFHVSVAKIVALNIRCR